MKCIRRPPNRLPSVLASLGRMISVISDSESATRRGVMLDSGLLMGSPAPKFSVRDTIRHLKRPRLLVNVHCDWLCSGYNGLGGGRSHRDTNSSFGNCPLF